MRLFIGTLLDATIQRRYRDLVDRLIARHGRLLRHIPAGSAHITYVFGARVPDARLNDVRAAVDDVAGRTQGWAVALGSPRAQVAGREARLVCADVSTGAAECRAMTDALLVALTAQVADVDWRPSRSPHVTLARFRRGVRGREAEAVLATLEESGARECVDEIRRLQTIQSALTPDGAVYTVAHESLLA